MRVRCMFRDKKSLPPNQHIEEVYGKDWDRFSDISRLNVGEEYYVFAVFWRHPGQVWYFVDDGMPLYPRPFPAPLFEISEPSIPGHWQFKHNGWDTPVAILSYSAWVSGPGNYDRLTDGEPDARQAYEDERAFAAAQRRIADGSTNLS